MSRCLQKRVQLLIKTRDGLKGILNSYDNELLHSPEHSPQLVARLEEAEDTVQKVEAHTAEMEVQLSQALEEAGNQKKKAEMLEAELRLLKSQESTKELSFFVAREGVNALRLKIEELESERSQLEEEKRALELKLKQVGNHDSSKTKVLHLSENPASLAKRQHLQEQANLREECQRLRERVQVLESGGSLPETSEGAGGLPEAAVSLPSTSEVTELKTELESEKKKNQRLKEIFHSKIQEFRKVYYTLTGYQIDMTCESQYRVTSMYAEHKEDCLIFRAVKPNSPKMQLMETEFSKTLGEIIDLHLHQQKSFPAFLSALTLDLVSRQTVA
ncbi:mitotic spindle assembly checkpoint protein MAD1 [Paroedura picta]|uniref:mitotic spindle assembly checkpoint protein MAD1 n=1 Tax=Paroedura picta TaxID=143630 RepID=UPI004057710B